LSVLEEYRRREQEYEERANDLAQVTRMRDTVKAEQDNLMKARLDEFMQGFNIITQKLKEMYQVGKASFELFSKVFLLTHVTDDYFRGQCRIGTRG
jgi:chromosome segregation ATPase